MLLNQAVEGAAVNAGLQCVNFSDNFGMLERLKCLEVIVRRSQMFMSAFSYEN